MNRQDQLRAILSSIDVVAERYKTALKKNTALQDKNSLLDEQLNNADAEISTAVNTAKQACQRQTDQLEQSYKEKLESIEAKLNSEQNQVAQLAETIESNRRELKSVNSMLTLEQARSNELRQQNSNLEQNLDLAFELIKSEVPGVPQNVQSWNDMVQFVLSK